MDCVTEKRDGGGGLRRGLRGGSSGTGGKRRRDEIDEIEEEERYEPLTERNLKKKSRTSLTLTGIGRGKSASALEQWGFVGMKRSQGTRTESGSSSTTSKSISSTNPKFPRILKNNGVREPVNSTAPANIEEIKSCLDRQRVSASPDESAYQDYVYRTQTAPNEDSMLYETLPLLKRYKDRGYRAVFNRPFSEFPSNVGFNDGLSAAKPDMVEGIVCTEYEESPVLERLGGAAVPTPDSNALALAQMTGEWKGPGKDMVTARSQAAYAGASLVYARNQARASIGKPDPPGYSYVSSFTTDGTTINTFAHFAETSRNKTVYNQYQVASTLLTGSYEDFKKGRRQIRNLQDLAKENSYALKTELLEYFETEEADAGTEANVELNELAAPQTIDGGHDHRNGIQGQNEDEDYEIINAAEQQPLEPDGAPPESSVPEQWSTKRRKSRRIGKLKSKR